MHELRGVVMPALASVPAFAMATPMTCAAGGRRFVAIAAGGHGALGGTGDSVIAFALPPAP